MPRPSQVVEAFRGPVVGRFFQPHSAPGGASTS